MIQCNRFSAEFPLLGNAQSRRTRSQSRLCPDSRSSSVSALPDQWLLPGWSPRLRPGIHSVGLAGDGVARFRRVVVVTPHEVDEPSAVEFVGVRTLAVHLPSCRSLDGSHHHADDLEIFRRRVNPDRLVFGIRALGLEFDTLSAAAVRSLRDHDCLGDILARHGFRRVYYSGYPLAFAGRGTFLADHGFDE